jgi:murein tripeptide amidase MpaA/pyruvoyl-dependent arginine decarboxylase (PvlArgDC)
MSLLKAPHFRHHRGNILWIILMQRYALLGLCILFSSVVQSATPSLETTAEKTGFKKTGRYEEVIQLCSDFQKAYPKAVRCVEFGRTPENRPMLALIASRSGALNSKDAKAKKIPILLIQGGIHAGEIDGKDAGFLALRDVMNAPKEKNWLKNQVLIFVPVFNIDGHERFAAWNRPNQRGPEEMGWRTTAQNFNLNRDYAKADTPEMQAMLRLVNEWDPIAYIDLHVTDGAKFQHDISIQVQPTNAGDSELQKAGLAMKNDVLAELKQKGSLPVGFYPSFNVNDDPSSGFTDSIAPPRFSTGYFYLRNRFGMLVETHSWKDYATRVRITRNTIDAMLRLTAEHGKDWQAVAKQADLRSSNHVGQKEVLDYTVSDKARTIDFMGYEYTRTPSEISGQLMTRYDETKPQIWKLPLKDEIIIGNSETMPTAYIVPPAYAALVSAKLQQHGISYRIIDKTISKAAVETFRADTAKQSAQSVESHQRLTVTGEWKAEPSSIKVGSLYVPLDQAKSKLIMALLEAKAPDSLLGWGFFNNSFEQKEYMEDYVAEEVAREMLAKDPALAAAFKKKIAEDAEFAKDPQARLQYFYKLHSAWDEEFNQYPVMRLRKAL